MASDISLARLSVVGEHLVGRDKELSQLHDAWHDTHTNVVTVVGWAGIGKSALVSHWLAELAKEDFRGAAKVFGWTFFAAGHDSLELSADMFVTEALRWLVTLALQCIRPWKRDSV